MLHNKRISVLIPAFNEEKSIAKVIKELPKDIVDEIVVVDNASTDATLEVALRSGAKVVEEPQRGYGAACLKGIESIDDTDIVVIIDGDHSDYPEQIDRLLEPIVFGDTDFVIGSRVLGKREDGALTPQQYWGNKLAVFLIHRIFGYKFTDMGPFRAIRFDSLKSLNMTDKNFGWNTEMQIKAIKNGLKIKEIAVDYRKRIGVSKISGTLFGTIKAGVKIILTIIRYAFFENRFTCKQCGFIYKQKKWAIKNAFLSVLEKHEIKRNALCRTKLTTLQVNMGNLCNQACTHCHIEASPKGKKIMPREIVDDIIAFLKNNKMRALDITGGAPELNPHFEYFVESARPLVDELIVRSNLTVLFEKGKEKLPEFFRLNKVHLICSLPCYTKENVDRQRGAGVFEKSIKALKLLNETGFTKRSDLQLDLVYNALGAYLPGSQSSLEKDYKKALKDNYGIEFNKLLTITNVPVKKFKNYLEANNEYEKYSDVLENNFNPATIEALMCRTFLSIGYDGRLYDCDFNLALGYSLKDALGNELTLNKPRIEDLEEREIITGEYCLACTAGSGSSCQGALTNDNACGAIAQDDKKESVKEYYGKILRTKKDLKTSACCSIEAFSEPMKSIVKNIEPEILDKFYGCGSPLPPLLEGCRVLDLGSGTGRDVYIASALVGEQGFVTGVDMTDEQLNVARKYKDAQMKRFGFKRCNADFKKGYIEDLKEACIEDNSQDVVISNCVINLSPDKRKVFSEIFRVLKPGGELYFADVFADRRIPDDVKNDPVLYGECLGGAMYIEDFRRMLRDLGFLDVRYMSKRVIAIDDPKIAAKTGNIVFCSVTVRAFKLDDLEDICEDFGQVAYYQGSIPEFPHQFDLDDHHVFFTGKPMLVCGNTASMLTNTRYGKHFKIVGNKSRHFGPFPCLSGRQAYGPTPAASKADGVKTGGSCC